MHAGLDAEYNPLVTSMTTRVDLVNLNNLYAHLLSFEMWLDLQNAGANFSNSSANIASRGYKGNRGRSHGGRNGDGGRGRGHNNNNFG